MKIASNLYSAVQIEGLLDRESLEGRAERGEEKRQLRDDQS